MMPPVAVEPRHATVGELVAAAVVVAIIIVVLLLWKHNSGMEE